MYRLKNKHAMQKTVIILSVLALLAVGYGQAQEKSMQPRFTEFCTAEEIENDEWYCKISKADSSANYIIQLVTSKEELKCGRQWVCVQILDKTTKLLVQEFDVSDWEHDCANEYFWTREGYDDFYLPYLLHNSREYETNENYYMFLFDPKTKTFSLDIDKEEDDESYKYTINTLTIFGKEIDVQTEASWRGFLDDDYIYSSPLYGVELETNNNNAIIKFNHLYPFPDQEEGVYWLYLKKEKSGAIYIYEEFLWYPNAFVDIETDLRCHHICRKKVSKLVNKKIVFADYFNFENSDKECFDCPRQYSLKECLKMKKSGKAFIWQEE
jgi:hypothetical protein